MLTNKHIDRICIVTVILSIVLTAVFMNGSNMGLVASDRVMNYESRIFDTSRVHTLDIVMDSWDEFITGCEDEQYEACTVVIDGEAFKNVGLRAKGNTSLSSVRSMGSQRYSFKIEFDQYEDGKSYYGLDKLCLNNLIQDNTMMKDYLTYQMMYDFGVDSPLSSYVYVTVNGEDWGLYLAVEAVEDSFLERNYGANTGDLYKPDTMNFGAGRGNGKDFSMSDFSEQFSGSDDESDGENAEETTEKGGNSFHGGFNFGGGDFNFDTSNFDASEKSGRGGGFGGMFGGMGSDDVKLKYIDDDPDSYSNIFSSAKTVVTTADQNRLINSLKNLTNYTDLENSLDMDEVLRYFVVHLFVDNGDSYTGSMIHNYYLHEGDGKLSMIPWDYNLAFGTFMGGNGSSSVNKSIDDPLSGSNVDDRPMLGWIFSSEEYTDEYHKLYAEFIDRWFSEGQLEQLIKDTEEMIRPYVEKDPTRFCTVEEFDTGVDTITSYVTLRGEAVSRQLEGDDTPVEVTGLNTSAMGSMGGSMGGGGFSRGGSKGGPSRDVDNSDEKMSKTVEYDSVSETRTFDSKPEGAGAGNMPEGMDFNNMPGGMDFGNMPEGMDFNNMPGGMDFGNMPGGMNFSNMPEGMDFSNMPGGMGSDNSDNVKEKTSDADSDKTAADNAGNENQDENSSSDAKKESSRSSRMGGGMNFGDSQVTEIVLVAVSVVILIVGIIIAKKKKKW